MNDDLMSIFDGIDIVDDSNDKKETKKSKKEEKKKESKDAGKQYRYPFRICLAAGYPDINHIFAEEKEYSEKDISQMMLEHGFYEFAGKVAYDYRQKENVLIPIFQQPKKG